MPEFTEAELEKMQSATRVLLRDVFIPRDNADNEHCKDVYNVIANPRYKETIEENLANVGFKLNISTDPGVETAWVVDSDDESMPKGTLRKPESMVYCLLAKRFFENRSSETKKTAAVIDVQTLLDQMNDLGMRLSKNEMREILFDAQNRNLVNIRSSKAGFDKLTTVIVLSSICFFFPIETISGANEYLDLCAAERKGYESAAKTVTDEDDVDEEESA